MAFTDSVSVLPCRGGCSHAMKKMSIEMSHNREPWCLGEFHQILPNGGFCSLHFYYIEPVAVMTGRGGGGV